ncbi:MAG: polysaccharide biosynthesis/export family protein [Geopsychrobacter sp.]|nr:polysaccharide biosynthesis/export family protein [Geopsychrobacter sp.]
MKQFFVLVILLLSLSVPALAADYVIGDGDVLQVSVWGVPELSVLVKVRPDGKITLPAAGDVAASGFTPASLSKEFSKFLSKYVKEPIVTVTVTEITNNKVYISGGGIPSRVVSLPGRTTLFKLLCQLENVENTYLQHAYLLRKGKRILTNFYPLFIKGDMGADIELQAEDIIHISNTESNKIYVVGAVKEPKYIPFREGIKVLDAILEAGGFNEYAKENDVIIMKKNNVRLRVKIKNLMRGDDLKQNLPLSAGDYVIVSESIF